MQTIYIITGCDYISFFKFIGKKSFLDTYFQHAHFISGSQMPGCLSQMCPEVNEHGFLAIIRLIHCKKKVKITPIWVTRIATSKGDCNSGNPKGVILTFIFYSVGTVYFKQHVSTFSSRHTCKTPEQLFNSIGTQNIIDPDKHKLWLDKIRTMISSVINNKEERVPSHTSLWRHWLRSS